MNEMHLPIKQLTGTIFVRRLIAIPVDFQVLCFSLSIYIRRLSAGFGSCSWYQPPLNDNNQNYN